MNITKLPNFIISGFPKCGTTALHYYLEGHPQIFMPKQKELHYFTNPILSHLNQGPGDKETKMTQISSFKQYLDCFKNSKDEKAIGDASPSYINYPELFEKINDKLDKPKVIIMLRDPVKRAYSNYLHLVREHRESLDFYSALLEEENRKKAGYSDFWHYKFNSSYFDKIESAKDVFGTVLILTQEELNSDTQATLKKIFKFLNVDEDYIPTNLENRYNAGGLFSDNVLTRFVFKPNRVKSLIKKAIPIPVEIKDFKNRLISKYRKPTPPIDIKAEGFLVTSLKDDVQKLKKLGINVSDWNDRFFD